MTEQDDKKQDDTRWALRQANDLTAWEALFDERDNEYLVAYLLQVVRNARTGAHPHSPRHKRFLKLEHALKAVRERWPRPLSLPLLSYSFLAPEDFKELCAPDILVYLYLFRHVGEENTDAFPP